VSKKLYVGNLSFTTTEEELKTLFAQFGEVKSVAVIKDRDTGRSRGFGFVEMENPEAAVAGTNGKDFGGRTLTVNEARERESRSGGDRGGFGEQKRSW
jgi:RNA recognition motif-containing protein